MRFSKPDIQTRIQTDKKNAKKNLQKNKNAPPLTILIKLLLYTDIYEITQAKRNLRNEK